MQVIYALHADAPLSTLANTRTRPSSARAVALIAEEIGPTSAQGVQANLQHDRFLESLGGWGVDTGGT
jgi:hypothetical protein